MAVFELVPVPGPMCLAVSTGMIAWVPIKGHDLADGPPLTKSARVINPRLGSSWRFGKCSWEGQGSEKPLPFLYTELIDLDLFIRRVNNR